MAKKRKQGTNEKVVAASFNGRSTDNDAGPSKKKLKKKISDDVPTTSKIHNKKEHVKSAEKVEDRPEEENPSDDESIDEEEEEDFLQEDGDGEILDFEFEAFPMEEDDVDGVANMLTQIFLNADLDLRKIAKALIEQSPFGSVIGPAESSSDEETTNVVYGLLSLLPIDSSESPSSEIAKFLVTRAKKHAGKETTKELENALNGSCSWLINERMLKFPGEIAAPSFKAFHEDVKTMEKKPEKIIYIHKIRMTDSEPMESVPSKRKLGKAEKKRRMIEALKSADAEYDNFEDKLLLELQDGKAVFFDYNVQGEVDVGSKFGIQVRNGKTFRPYRRVVIMDYERFESFVNAVKNC